VAKNKFVVRPPPAPASCRALPARRLDGLYRRTAQTAGPANCQPVLAPTRAAFTGARYGRARPAGSRSLPGTAFTAHDSAVWGGRIRCRVRPDHHAVPAVPRPPPPWSSQRYHEIGAAGGGGAAGGRRSGLAVGDALGGGDWALPVLRFAGDGEAR